MYCTKCGTYNPDESAFCSACGARLSATHNPEDPNAPAPVPKSAPASAPAGQPGDQWLFGMAVVPLLVSWLLIRFVPNITTTPLPGIAALILNVIFYIFDKHECWDHDVDVEKLGWMAFLLVPVYLVVRATKTTRNYIPFVLWILLFLIDLGIIPVLLF